jgi:hypothetical protein
MATETQQWFASCDDGLLASVAAVPAASRSKRNITWRRELSMGKFDSGT